jgi:hypothetical protein
MEGSISVESIVGIGTTFSCTIVVDALYQVENLIQSVPIANRNRNMNCRQTEEEKEVRDRRRHLW